MLQTGELTWLLCCFTGCFLTVYKDGGYDMSTKVKPEHLDGPLVAGGSTAALKSAVRS